MRSLAQLHAMFANMREHAGAAKGKAVEKGQRAVRVATDPLWDAAYGGASAALKKGIATKDEAVAKVREIPKTGKSYARTLSFGGRVLDRGIAAVIDMSHTAAESYVAHKVNDSATRLQHNFAQLSAMNQRRMTEASFHGLNLGRERVARHLGPMDEAEKAMIEKVQAEIRTQQDDLLKLGKLRVQRDRALENAAHSAVAQMKARGRGHKLMLGEVDSDIAEDVLRTHTHSDPTAHNLNRLGEMVRMKAHF